MQDVTFLDHRQATLDDARERIRAGVSVRASEGLTVAAIVYLAALSALSDEE